MGLRRKGIDLNAKFVRTTESTTITRQEATVGQLLTAAFEGRKFSQPIAEIESDYIERYTSE